MENWSITTGTTTSGGAYYMPVVTTGSNATTWVMGGGGGGAGWQPQPPRPQTALEWLDGEVEKTCALARG